MTTKIISSPVGPNLRELCESVQTEQGSCKAKAAGCYFLHFLSQLMVNLEDMALDNLTIEEDIYWGHS